MEKKEIFKVALFNDESCRFDAPRGMSKEEILDVLTGIFVEFFVNNFEGDVALAFHDSIERISIKEKKFDA